jgi:uncharacterized membrane protein YgcG
MTNKMNSGDKPARSAVEVTGARPAGLAGKVQLSAETADAVLAIVPHLLGFYPTRSLVVLGLGDRNRVMVTFRYDLPDPPDVGLADDIADHAEYVLNRERLSAAMLVGYGPDDLVAPVILTAATRLAKAGIDLHEVLLADGGRYWSLLCGDPMCCPEEGRAYDPGSHPAAAVMTSAGLTAFPDREALTRTLQRPAGSADRIAQATRSAQSRLAGLLRRGEADGDDDPQLRLTRIGRKAVQRAIKVYRSGGSLTGTTELTWLAVLLADLRVRDDAWARMDQANNPAHCRLWTDVIRAAVQDYVPAPASLLAFCAWQAGNGALAAVAVERALRADPGYSMAKLLSQVVEAALPPSAAQMPMSPAQVAESYAPVLPAPAGGGVPGRRQRADGELAGGRRGNAGRSGRGERGGIAGASGNGGRGGNGGRRSGGRRSDAGEGRARPGTGGRRGRAPQARVRNQC